MLGLYPPVKLERDFRSDHHVFFFCFFCFFLHQALTIIIVVEYVLADDLYSVYTDNPLQHEKKFHSILNLQYLLEVAGKTFGLCTTYVVINSVE